MPKLLDEVYFDGSVLDLIVIDDKIFVIDSTMTLSILNTEGFRLLRKVPLVEDVKASEHPYAKSATLSITGAVAFIRNGHDIVVKSFLKGGEGVSYGKRFETSLEVLQASSDGKYLAVGGTDGKVTVYYIASGQLAAELSPRPDYISALAFSANSQLIASGSYDKVLSVYDLDRNTPVTEVRFGDVIEDCRFIDGDKQIYLAMREGNSVIYSLEEERIVSENVNFIYWPTKVQMNENRRYAIVGSRSDKLYVIDMENNTARFNLTLERHGISMLKLRAEHLFVGFIDGTLQVLAYDQHIEELRIALKTKDFVAAQALIGENIFLQLYAYCVEKFEEGWQELLPRLERLIANQKLEEAVALAQPFLDDPARKKHFSQMTEQCEQIADFVAAVNGGDFPTAFRLLERYTWFSNLEAHSVLEKGWTQTFKKAKNLLCKDPVINRREVQMMLKPYTYHEPYGVQIADLLRYPEVFADADEAVKRKDFREYFLLVGEHPFLRETILHERVMQLGNIILQKSIQLERSDRYDDATEGFSQLELFGPFGAEARKHLKLIERKIEMAEAVEDGNLERAYVILNEQPEMRNSHSGYEKLKERFESILDQAQRSALQGKVSVVLKLLGAYLPIEYCKYKVLMVLSIAYTNEMRLQRQEMERIDWEKTIANYLHYMGKDDNLEKVCGVLGLRDLYEKADTPFGGEDVVNYPASILVLMNDYSI